MFKAQPHTSMIFLSNGSNFVVGDDGVVLGTEQVTDVERDLLLQAGCTETPADAAAAVTAPATAESLDTDPPPADAAAPAKPKQR
jgi:hypothetical protein